MKSISVALCIIQDIGNEVSRLYLKVNIFPLLDVMVTEVRFSSIHALIFSS
jgi:hypothetical protein